MHQSHPKDLQIVMFSTTKRTKNSTDVFSHNTDCHFPPQTTGPKLWTKVALVEATNFEVCAIDTEQTVIPSIVTQPVQENDLKECK
jgi:hypothetical protein